jgi:hypothetical protein
MGRGEQQDPRLMGQLGFGGDAPAFNAQSQSSHTRPETSVPPLSNANEYHVDDFQYDAYGNVIFDKDGCPKFAFSNSNDGTPASLSEREYDYYLDSVLAELGSTKEEFAAGLSTLLTQSADSSSPLRQTVPTGRTTEPTSTAGHTVPTSDKMLAKKEAKRAAKIERDAQMYAADYLTGGALIGSGELSPQEQLRLLVITEEQEAKVIAAAQALRRMLGGELPMAHQPVHGNQQNYAPSDERQAPGVVDYRDQGQPVVPENIARIPRMQPSTEPSMPVRPDMQHVRQQNSANQRQQQRSRGSLPTEEQKARARAAAKGSGRDKFRTERNVSDDVESIRATAGVIHGKFQEGKRKVEKAKKYISIATIGASAIAGTQLFFGAATVFPFFGSGPSHNYVATVFNGDLIRNEAALFGKFINGGDKK